MAAVRLLASRFPLITPDEGCGSKPSQVEVQLHATSDDEELDTFAATCAFRCDSLVLLFPTERHSHQCTLSRNSRRPRFTARSATRWICRAARHGSSLRAPPPIALARPLVRARGDPPLARGLAVSSVRWNSMDAPDDADSIAYATWDQLLKEKRMISLEKKSHDEGIF